jgi:hypothetical protein
MGNDEEHTFASDATHSLRNGSLSVYADRGPDAPRITVLDGKARDSYPIAGPSPFSVMEDEKKPLDEGVCRIRG